MKLTIDPFPLILNIWIYIYIYNCIYIPSKLFGLPVAFFHSMVPPRMLPGFTTFANTVEVHGLVLERPHTVSVGVGVGRCFVKLPEGMSNYSGF